MKVVYSAEALGDVAHILSYVADESPSHAADLAARIATAVKALGVFPRAARFDHGTDTYERPIAGLPLVLIYTVGDHVKVIAVFHTSRDPARKRRR